MSKKPLYKFDVPTTADHFLTFRVWSDIDTLRSVVTPRHPEWSGDEYLACYLGTRWRYDVKSNGTSTLKSKKLGEIHLAEGEFGVGIVSHEIQHFINSWIDHLYDTLVNWPKKPKTFRPTDEPHNEDIAYLAGHINRVFWERYYSLTGKDGNNP